jgi:hypothetical protein
MEVLDNKLGVLANMYFPRGLANEAYLKEQTQVRDGLPQSLGQQLTAPGVEPTYRKPCCNVARLVYLRRGKCLGL